MATLRSISDEINFKSKTASRDKVGYYVMMKGQPVENITMINIWKPKLSIQLLQRKGCTQVYRMKHVWGPCTKNYKMIKEIRDLKK